MADELKAAAGPPPPDTQAQRVIDKFGGARSLTRAMHLLDPSKHRNPSSVYRWLYKGYIPNCAMGDVLEAARIEGVFLTADDLHPGRK